MAFGSALALAVGTVLAAAVPASAPQQGLSLPEPTGRYQVGETGLHLVDESRGDPWQPGQRELMVSVHYPALRSAGFPAAPYMLPGAAAHFDETTVNGLLGLDLPTGTDWASVRTHASQGAPAMPGRHPVVVYSPGLGEPRTWGTAEAEDLASRGYVVVSIDHTHESPEVQFPDGSVRTMVTPDDPDAFIRKALEVRVADTSFVLDELSALAGGQNPDAEHRRLPTGLAGALDLTRIGMVGHSLGGSAAALAMRADTRISAGADLDGNLTYYDGTLMAPAEQGLMAPFLLLGKDGDTDTGPGWSAFLAHTHDWARQLKLLGSQHASFTDAEALLPQLGQPDSVLRNDIGPLDPATAVRTQRAYVASFFDRFLRHRDNHLLDGPSPRYPDMAFVA
ncbi:Tat pathway signal protein [Amycolatopsis acidicola]|uniref:Tat pathway signal protein n=1 Tax=Amycolatopsis acidicola TaxID=2596893 RepID=A0A5N0UXF2_9PSEU|nr:Tat pathway signal protein [Amycolatopsis acidicola]KAA9156974.1 Tat pathway signal protein [Amycolatopsis acidicola]